MPMLRLAAFTMPRFALHMLAAHKEIISGSSPEFHEHKAAFLLETSGFFTKLFASLAHHSMLYLCPLLPFTTK